MKIIVLVVRLDLSPNIYIMYGFLLMLLIVIVRETPLVPHSRSKLDSDAPHSHWEHAFPDIFL